MNQTKDPAEMTLSELMIQHMMRAMNKSMVLYTWDQSAGQNNVQVEASYWSENMSHDELALSGHLTQYIKEKGYNQINERHSLRLEMKDGCLTIYKWKDMD